jgi:hypothetical protein
MWAAAYRKYFWDFVGGTLGPAGIMYGSFTFVAMVGTRIDERK